MKLLLQTTALSLSLIAASFATDVRNTKTTRDIPTPGEPMAKPVNPDAGKGVTTNGVRNTKTNK